MENSKTQNIVALGDSITEGSFGGAMHEQTWTVLLEKMLQKSGYNFKVLKSGIPGEVSPQGLNRFHPSVVNYDAHIVLIMYGANDCYLPFGYGNPVVKSSDFKRAINQIVVEAFNSNISPILMTTTPFRLSGNYQTQEILLEKYMDIIRDIAIENKISIIDHYKHWKNLENSGKKISDFLPDGVHPNARGNEVIANYTFEKLQHIL